MNKASWIHTNLNGKISMVLGALALVFIIATITSPALNDGKPGLINYLVSNISASLSPQKSVPEEPIAVSTGFLPLTEKNEKHFLTYFSIFLVALSLLFAIIAAKTKEFNLYYASGLLASFTALSFVNFTFSTIIFLLSIILIQKLRGNDKSKSRNLGLYFPKLIIAVLSSMLSIAFACLARAYSQLPFNSLGRYFDEGTGIVLHEQSTIGIIFIAIIFFFAAALSFSRIWKRSRKK